jgi:hypothetical protein
VTVTIAELRIADAPDDWRAAGLAVVGDTAQVGSVLLRFVGREAGTGIVGWSLRGVAEAAQEQLETAGLDGVPTLVAETTPAAPGQHPLGVTRVDHLVLTSPDLARTTAALESLGLDVRRVRDFDIAGTPMRQVFFRLGEVILELLGDPAVASEGPASFWGITFAVADIDKAAALLDQHVGRVKDAVQPGRRITTVRHKALGLSVATALMSEKEKA